MDYSSSTSANDPNLMAGVEEHLMSESTLSSTESDPESSGVSSPEQQMNYDQQGGGRYSPFNDTA